MKQVIFKNDRSARGIVEKVFITPNQKVEPNTPIALISTQFRPYYFTANCTGEIESINIKPGDVIENDSVIATIKEQNFAGPIFNTSTIFDSSLFANNKEVYDTTELDDDMVFLNTSVLDEPFDNEYNIKQEENLTIEQDEPTVQLFNQDEVKATLEDTIQEDEVFEMIHQSTPELDYADALDETDDYEQQAKNEDNQEQIQLEDIKEESGLVDDTYEDLLKTSTSQDINSSNEIIESINFAVPMHTPLSLKSNNEVFSSTEFLKSSIESNSAFEFKKDQENIFDKLMESHEAPKTEQAPVIDDSIFKTSLNKDLRTSLDLLRESFANFGKKDEVKNDTLEINVTENKESDLQEFISVTNEVDEKSQIVEKTPEINEFDVKPKFTTLPTFSQDQIQKINKDTIHKMHNYKGHIHLDKSHSLPYVDSKTLVNKKEINFSLEQQQIRSLLASESVSIPTATLNAKIEVTDLLTLCEVMSKARTDYFQKATLPATLYILAVGRALAKFPIFTASFNRQKQLLNLNESVNIDYNIHTRERSFCGVIENADTFKFSNLNVDLSSDIAKQKKQTPEDIINEDITWGNVFLTINQASKYIVYEPKDLVYDQVAHISINEIGLLPTFKDKKLVDREFIKLNVSFDKSLISLKEAADFIESVSELLSNPGLLI